MEEVNLETKAFLKLADSAFRKWLENHASLRAASLAYFVILPLPSLFLIIMMILSQIYGQTDSFQTLIQQITTIVGPAIANLIRQILETAKTPFTSIIASITTIFFTFVGALGALGVMQDTMNTIWGVTQVKRSYVQRLKSKIVPFFLISVLGLTIMVWTGFTTVMFDFITSLLVPFTSTIIGVFLQIIQIILSFALATLLFAFIYKYVPDLPIQWRDVRLAATITGLIFTVTNYLIGAILEVFTITSVTGAAGAVMILLLWIYLITQLVIYGAAFSKVYSEKIGSYSSKQIQFKKNPNKNN